MGEESTQPWRHGRCLLGTSVSEGRGANYTEQAQSIPLSIPCEEQRERKKGVSERRARESVKERKGERKGASRAVTNERANGRPTTRGPPHDDERMHAATCQSTTDASIRSNCVLSLLLPLPCLSFRTSAVEGERLFLIFLPSCSTPSTQRVSKTTWGLSGKKKKR